MRNSPRWWNGSVNCRLEWRPSRLLQALLILLGVLAAVAVLASEMPRPFAWPGAFAALGHGAWRARREGRSPRRLFWFPGDGRLPTVDGTPMLDARLLWRGPLAFLRWRERAGGRWRRAAWWPDTLPAPQRRELRLAAGDGDAGRHRRDRAP
jgi:toxin CptA